MTNRLADETSPYLRQHADNPLDWYPWGAEAFERAQAEDKPIFLSVGYSACHWCHVMAHESFEDPATAEVVNDLFVCVKVDREERPDIDAIYMDAVQAMTGHGGWPMTVFLTPTGEPFHGGTYYPRERRSGMPSFLDVCRAIDDVWHTRRDDVLAQAAQITEAVNRSARVAGAEEVPPRSCVEEAAEQLLRQLDRDWGGFGSAPKFPQTMSLELLLRHHVRSGDPDTLAAVTTSLDAMASGGIYDHIGGGFARYAVDRIWLVPHFEKMLYDQALLARVYLHAWQVTGQTRYRQVLDEVIGYVLRDLAHPAGGFFSAEDADSEGEEGKFAVWALDEVREVLSTGAPEDPTLADDAITWWGMTDRGNFEGHNIPLRPVRGEWERDARIERARALLYERRCTRVRPGLDDKVLTEWNALFLASLAEAALVADDPTWRSAALRCGEFLLAHLRDDEGRWLRSWQGPRNEDGSGGRARHRAVAADHAALIDAFCRLAACTGEARWIDAARGAADALLERFWDHDDGGLFTVADDGEQLVARAKDLLDNATPSANGNAATALLRLAALTDEERYRDAAGGILRLLGQIAQRHPTAVTQALAALELWHDGTTEIVVAGDAPELVRVAAAPYLPNAVLAWGEPFASPLWEGRAETTPPAAFVCRNYACNLPAHTPDELRTQLRAGR